MSHVRNHASLALLVLGFVVAVALIAGRLPGDAEADAANVEAAVIAVTGEGSTARGWYQGASPPGVNLQDALDRFASKGFRIVEVTMPHKADTTEGEIWYILLERNAP